MAQLGNTVGIIVKYYTLFFFHSTSLVMLKMNGTFTGFESCIVIIILCMSDNYT